MCNHTATNSLLMIRILYYDLILSLIRLSHGYDLKKNMSSKAYKASSKNIDKNTLIFSIVYPVGFSGIQVFMKIWVMI